MKVSTKGILHPAALPTFHRSAAPDSVCDLVTWFWIPEWDIEPGRTSRQHVLAHPASNLVVQPDGVLLAGPTTRRSHRDLTGRGWAVGALLRPAGLVPHLVTEPGAIRDAEVLLADELPVAELHSAVVAAMGSSDDTTARAQAVDAYVDWLRSHVAAPTTEALLANRMVELLETTPGVATLTDLARHLSVSPRTVQRLARKYVGLTPSVLARRRRLQDAAERLRTDPDVEIATVATDLGYADHAHLTHDFSAVLGLTPSDYRRAAHDPQPDHPGPPRGDD